MKYDFDTILDRRATNSEKWNIGKDELPLTTADMDFKTAPEIISAMKEKIMLGVFGYEYPSEQYYEAVAYWYEKEHAIKLETDWMQFTTGVIPALTASVAHFSQGGDKVLLMVPVYNIFYNSILNSGRQVLESELQYDQKEYKYTIDWNDLEQKLADPLTTLMILCNPHNPIGKVWSREELMHILKLAHKYGVIVISDEVHGDLVLKGADYTPTFSLPAKYCQNLITLVSTSKTFNLAALHAATGIVRAPLLRERFRRAVNKYEVAEPNLLAVPATVAAYRQGSTWLAELKGYLQKNREYLEEFLYSELPELHVVSGTATYLVWIDTSLISDNSQELVEKIRKKTGLLVNPGTNYHGNGKNFIRINIAYPFLQLQDGLLRLQKALK